MSHELETDRLLLRAPAPSDQARVAAQIGRWEVASRLARVPYPYPEDSFRFWLEQTENLHRDGAGRNFVITLKSDRAAGPVGAIGVEGPDAETKEVGYWIGMDYWGQGYASEALAAVVEYAFSVMGLERLEAGFFTDNPASGRVLEKAGFVATEVAERRSEAQDKDLPCQNMVLDRADLLAGSGVQPATDKRVAGR